MNGTTVRRPPGRKGTPQAEPKSKLPQTVAEVLNQHVVLEVKWKIRLFAPPLIAGDGAIRDGKRQSIECLEAAKGLVQAVGLDHSLP